MSVTKIKSQQLLDEVIAAIFPAGSVMFLAYHNANLPGFKFCDGSYLLRADYPALFAAIGTTYGTTNVNNFRLPDLRGQFIRGWAGGSAAVDPDGGTRAVGSTQTDIFKQHRHNIGQQTDHGDDGSAAGVTAGGLGGTVVSNAMFYEGGAETRPKNIAMAAYIKY